MFQQRKYVKLTALNTFDFDNASRAISRFNKRVHVRSQEAFSGEDVACSVFPEHITTLQNLPPAAPPVSHCWLEHTITC